MYTTLLPLFAIFAGAALLLVGNGLQGVLIPVRAELEQFATGVIALLSTAYSVGFVAGCLTTPMLVRRVGHIRGFAALAALAAAAILTMGLAVYPSLWIALRLASGFCLAGLFMVIESWLNEKLNNHNRGRVFSLYMFVNLTAVTAGHMLLPSADPSTNLLFVATGVAIVLALVPVSLTSAAAPAPIKTARLRLRRLYRMSPVGIVGCFFVGLANGAFGGLGPVFVQRLGFSVLEIALFVSASLVGGALFQLPVGRLSDRIDRRWTIIGVCAGAVAAAMAFISVGNIDPPGVATTGHGADSRPQLFVLGALLGGFIYTQYALCVAHTNDFIAADEFVEASGGLLLTYGMGAAIGPLLAAAAVTHYGPGALFAFIAVVYASYLLFTLYRISRRAAPPAQEHDPFVSKGVAARMTPAVAQIDPRAAPLPGRSRVAGVLKIRSPNQNHPATPAHDQSL